MLKRTAKVSSFLIAVLSLMLSLSFSVYASVEDDFGWYYGEDGAYIYGYYGTSTNVVIPSYIGSYPAKVTQISDWAFEDNTSIKSVTFPDTLTTIGDNAFSGCTNLTHITVPDSVTRVGMSAFYETNLQNLPEDEHFIYIGKVAYSYKGDFNYADIVFPDGTLGIADGMFYVSRFAGPKSVVIPDSVKTIGDWAFKNCSVLESVTIGDGVEYIGEGAFDVYSDLTIYCYEGSYALDYAKRNGLSFEVLEKPLEPIGKYTIGDCDDSGSIDIFDVTYIQRHIASLLSEQPKYKEALDVNADGDISILDATEVQRYIALYDVDCAIGEVVMVYPEVIENRVRFNGFSIDLPDDWTYVCYEDRVMLCERYNYETGWSGTLAYILKYDEKPSDENRASIYLGESGGIHYVCYEPTSVEYNIMDAYSRERYETAKKTFYSTIRSIRFENPQDGRTYYEDFSLKLTNDFTYVGDENQVDFYSKYCFENGVSDINYGYLFTIVKTTLNPSDFPQNTKLIATNDGYNYIRVYPMGLGVSSNAKANEEREKAMLQEDKILKSFKFN